MLLLISNLAINGQATPQDASASEIGMRIDGMVKNRCIELILSGEQAAMGSVVEEARRLSSQWNYNPCPSVLFGNLLWVIQDFSRWAISEARS